MHADLDLLLISVYCTADDLLPQRRANARRRLTDAEIVTLCVAQVLMGIPSDRRFLRAARRQLGHLFPRLPSQDALHKRRARLARDDRVADRRLRRPSPGASDDLLLLDSTPVECGRSRRDRPPLPARRRLRLRLLHKPLPLVLGDATPPRLCARRHAARGGAGRGRPARTRGRAHPPAARARRRRDDRLRQGLRRPRVRRGRRELGAIVLRPPRRTSHRHGPHLAPIRQRIESVFWTCKDLLTLERHGARTPRNLFARIAIRLLALAACISLNHQLGRPSRAIADYTA